MFTSSKRASEASLAELSRSFGRLSKIPEMIAENEWHLIEARIQQQQTSDAAYSHYSSAQLPIPCYRATIHLRREFRSFADRGRLVAHIVLPLACSIAGERQVNHGNCDASRLSFIAEPAPRSLSPPARSLPMFHTTASAKPILRMRIALSPVCSSGSSMRRLRDCTKREGGASRSCQ